MAEVNNYSISGYTIIWITAIIGGLIIASGIYYGTKRTDEKNNEKNEARIQKLQDTLQQKNNELQKKQDTIQSLTEDLGVIAKSISTISSNTNQITNLIKNEQRERGKISFSNTYGEYTVVIGTIGFGANSKKLTYGLQFFIHGIPFKITNENGELVLTTSFYNNSGELLFEINKGEWTINKSNIFSINYDANGVEIIDKKGFILLQIDLNENVFSFSGTKVYDDRISLLNPYHKHGETLFFNDSIFSEKLDYYNLERMFRHNGEDYLGKRSIEYIRRKEEISRKEKELKKELKRYDTMTMSEIIQQANLFIDILKSYGDRMFVKKDDGSWDTRFKRFSSFELNKILNEFYVEYDENGLKHKLLKVREILISSTPKYKKYKELKSYYNEISTPIPLYFNPIVKELELLILIQGKVN